MGNCNNCDCNFGDRKYEYDDNVSTFCLLIILFQKVED